ncbi:sulfurtransferase-like selenium metabolism protein YedF [Flavonifractor sp. AGMB03687]|uniref:sulfurtransferase-like selenium metabolism protein YedF n=1 Tax=Flavonifractor sp. AGMB03687 TaxID=2785133 RepID=UPI001ADF38A8|nr:sulfurtransferase-like selenium metabolism protein YedF [Flavonifractor sp. AGMB03687]
MAHIVDAKGKPCPTPVILAKQAMTQGHTAFTVLVDNPTAVENLKRLAGNQGFTVSVREDNNTFALDFAKGEGCSACEEAVNSPLPAAGGDWVVFVGRDIIGDGDRELGTNLMRMFFYTLAQGEDKPGAVLFMNAGVKLPTLDEQVVDHLKALSDAGTEILVCGTCLNFYGIAEQLKVGTVSNMYDIVTRMQKAGKVISL